MKKLRTDPQAYYELRKQDPHALIGADAAARFFILNRLCFNGLYRTNLKGQFNVPYGRHKSIAIDFNLYHEAADMLTRATLIHGDFEQTIEHAGANDFVFLDPPYITRATRGFSEYLPESFSFDDLERLERVLVRLDRRNVKFAITYLDCPEARKLLRRWNPGKWTVRRNIAGFSAHRKTSTELLATN
jgi:DNA adenine methylase